jgi:hypothetical protein
MSKVQRMIEAAEELAINHEEASHDIERDHILQHDAKISIEERPITLDAIDTLAKLSSPCRSIIETIINDVARHSYKAGRIDAIDDMYAALRGKK